MSDLTRSEVEQLATYNAERYRGILHSDAWTARMQALQARFDRPMPVRPAPPNPGVWSCCGGNAARGHANWCRHHAGWLRWFFGRGVA